MFLCLPYAFPRIIIVESEDKGGKIMEMEMIVKLVFLGLIHWAVVPFALNSLIGRQRVLGNRKGLWVVPVLFVTCLGPLSYLIIHELLPETRKTQLDYNR